MFIFVILTIIGYSQMSVIHCDEVNVNIKIGSIRGYKEKVDDNYVNAFLGIPYAQPPIGELRFRKPLPIATKWSDTLNASKLPKYCMQDLSFLKPNDEVSEDCLYLNVWTSVNLAKDFSQSLKPVMVFIHGGIFTYWGSSNKHFNGSVLSSFGDVVVVTINYRLGAFGFLSTGNDDAPGNVGLYDQALALEWINENIAYFGGDANKVTVFGESAGAMSISLHLISPLLHNTINRAILMSSASFRNIVTESLDTGVHKAMKLSQLVGCNNDENMKSDEVINIECLRKVDAEKIVMLQVSPDVSILSTSLAKGWFFPIFGETFIPKKPNEMLLEGYMSTGVDLLIGTMADEGIVVDLVFNLTQISSKGENWNQKFESFILNFFKDLSSNKIEKLAEFYFNSVDDKSSDEAKMIYSTALGDVYFNCETFYFSEVVSKFNNVYQYLIEYLILNKDDRPLPFDVNKACHTFELPLTFGTVSDPKDFEVSKKWMKIVTDFAKTGTTDWPKHGNGKSPYYVFAGNESKDRILYNYRSEACKLWKPILEKYY